MERQEFEAIAKRKVTLEQYKAIEVLYMESNLDKYEFVKSIRGLLKTIEEPKPERMIVRVSVTDNSGCEYTPNGCWLHTIKAEIIDVDIKSGKILLKEIPDSYMLDSWVEYHHYDSRIKWVA